MATLMPAKQIDREAMIALASDKAARLRIHSIRSTTEAGSGHPTSCASAADIVSTLFFGVMRRSEDNSYLDRFILSKGHAAPLLYAAWAEAGAIPKERLLGLRKIDSDLEGHPTPRLPFVDVATGSLGQGLAAGVGLALNAKYLTHSQERFYVLLGDGECAEGSVWEAAASASYYKLSNLCAVVDINRLGQSGPTRLEHDLDAHARLWEACGWKAVSVDGHRIPDLLSAFEDAATERDRPTAILAKTIKGQGIPKIADQDGYHGKPLAPDQARAAIEDLEKQLADPPPASISPVRLTRAQTSTSTVVRGAIEAGEPRWSRDSDPVATREAFGEALAALGKASEDVVVLDADVRNSTKSELFGDSSDRFFEMFIAEQAMIGAAMGLAAAGRIPFASTFACFLTRAYDFLRMAAISGSNIKVVGSHAGISIGEDGPSQMGLEDLAMFCAQPNFTVLYPSDAVSAWRATEIAANLSGPVYVRTSRPATPILYDGSDLFEPARSKTLRQHVDDRVTIIAAGITTFEALKAHDLLAAEGIETRVIDLFSVQPLDVENLRLALVATEGRVVTVEDHYRRGGFGEAICSLATEWAMPLRSRILSVLEIPRSGTPDALLERYGIDAAHITAAVRSLL